MIQSPTLRDMNSFVWLNLIVVSLRYFHLYCYFFHPARSNVHKMHACYRERWLKMCGSVVLRILIEDDRDEFDRGLTAKYRMLAHYVESIIQRPNQRRLGRSSSRGRVFDDDANAAVVFLRRFKDKMVVAAAVVVAAACCCCSCLCCSFRS